MTTAGYYYLSNDAIDLGPLRRAAGDRTLIGVASPDVLHVLGGIAAGGVTLRGCVLFDNNPAQLAYLKRLFRLVIEASDRLDFLERLLCIRLGTQAKRLLASFRPSRPWQVPGAVAGAGHGELERAIWQDADFDGPAFTASTGLPAEATSNGLLLGSDVVGGMSHYLLTLVCVDTSEYPHTPFSVRYGYGFLSSDAAFARLQRLLASVDPTLVKADAAQDLVPTLLVHRYEPVLLWVSNIFTPYFIQRCPALGDTAAEIVELGTRVRQLPQMDITIVADGRVKGPLAVIKPRGWLGRLRMTAHYKTFAEVRRWMLNGPALEVVNVRSWIMQDKGRSKLPNTHYILLDDFIRDESSPKCDTVLLHVLLGHGASGQELLSAFTKARTVALRVLVLEHNSQSLDFIQRRDLMPLDDIAGLLGQPTCRVPVPGTFSRVRNWLLVYDLPSTGDSGGAPVRIGFVTPEYVTERSRDGGLAGYLHRTARALHELGHEPVVIVSADRNEQLLHDGVEVRRVCVENALVNFLDHAVLAWLPIKWAWCSWRLNREVARLAAQRRFDILQFASYTGTAFFRSSKSPAVVRLSSVQRLLHEHSGVPRGVAARLLEWFELQAVARGDALISPSTLIGRHVQLLTGRQVSIIESPADLAQPSDINVASRDRTRNRPYLFYFGTLSELKGLDILADALPRLFHAVPGLRLVMAGKQQSFRGRSMVEHIVGRAGPYADKVTYLGVLTRNELWPWLRDAEAVILPSRVDNLPNTCIEAMAAGKRVIAPRDASFEQLIEDGSNGFLFRNADAEDLARVTIAALSQHEVAAVSVEQNARKTVERLDPHRVTEDLVGFYRTLV